MNLRLIGSKMWKAPTRSSREEEHLDAQEEEPEEEDATGREPDGESSMDELVKILEFFPNVKTDFALQLLEEEENNVEQVLDRMVGMNGFYPKDIPESALKQKQAVKAEGPSGSPTHDFMSPTSFVPSHRYKWQSVELLVFHFPFLGARIAKVLLEANHNKFAIAHNAICQAILAKANTPMEPKDGRPFDELLLAVLFDKSSITAAERELLLSIFKHHNIVKWSSLLLPLVRKSRAPRVTCPILEEEVKHVRNHAQQLKLNLEKTISRRRARQASISAGEAMTCSCCYDEVAMDELVACRMEGHLFCEECLASYVENTLFGQGSLGVHPVTKEAATEILCCSGEGCFSGFDRFYLKKALPEKVLQKYDEMQAQLAIQQVPGLTDNMYSCPTCDFIFEVPSQADFYACPMEGCYFEACRRCGEPPHVGKLCREVEGETQTQGRTRVEEAVTFAVVRRCPSCKKGMMKSDGCNMITCPCRTKFCYCCQAKIHTYNHFCQKPHCKHTDPPNTCENKCPLYSDAEEDDREAMREAALVEATKVESETHEMEDRRRIPWGPSKSKQKVTVDVESILRMPRSYR